MSDLEDTNERPDEGQGISPDETQGEQSQEQAGPELPKILGPVSRAERGRLFEEWWKKQDYTFEASWKDSNNLMVAVERIDGSVLRDYFYLKPGYGFIPTASIEFRSNGSIVARAGDAIFFKKEGLQSLVYHPENYINVEATKDKEGISIYYTQDGELASIDFGLIVPTDQPPGENILTMRSLDKVWDIATPDGKFRMVNTAMQYVFCLQQERDTKGKPDTKIYWVPKKINAEDKLEKLVPQELKENPYRSPSKEDHWRTRGFLTAFGTKETFTNTPSELEVPKEEWAQVKQLLSPQGDDDSQGHHG